MMLSQALEFASKHRQQHLAALIEWLRIPSVSTLPEHAPDVRRAAEFAYQILVEMGMQRVEIHPTPGHPVVYAEWRLDENSDSKDQACKTGDSRVQAAPTLLIYGHYDVQPIDPIEQWTRPPFDPIIDGDNIYARGASDDKGQVMAVLSALRSYLQSCGRLPVNVKLLLEGEEEITSRNLFAYLQEHTRELVADAVLISDQDMLSPQHPVIMWGVRGQVYFEISVNGPSRDLHSGTFGGSVDNPLNVLVRLLASLQDATTRRVLVPGFYDSVDEPSQQDRELIARAPITDELGLSLTGAPALAGETGYSLAERVSVRPTLEIHGVSGGYSGEGSKTVIPSSASAKLGMRLVPNQNPTNIAEKTLAYLHAQCPNSVDLRIQVIGQAHPVRIDFNAEAIQAAQVAYHLGFGAAPVYLRGGGSLPIVHEMIQSLKSPAGRHPIPIVMIGFGLPDDGTHSPNEKFFLPNFYHGIDTVIHYLDQFSRIAT